ncbi:uncharacterized protein LOC124816922 isoform X3 [Hydra vulgaris]|uniref:Uncharacterized protein LOC124816922 isoform X3 n=1 Tax=Hydra vulgaris TaxID=6087 RepID=A0ABM4CSK7_HYDVU
MKSLFIRLAFFYATHLSVNPYITRLPCFLYANFNLVYNKYFNGDIALTHFGVGNVNECGTFCVRFPTCLFANYNANQKICKLMSSASNFSNSVTDSQSQVLTTDITSNKNIGPICESNTPCSNLYCRDVCLKDNQHSYICIESNDASRSATASLSSTWDSIYIASKAIDGSETTYAITANSQTTHWFKLDLNYIYQIVQIVVYNRMDYHPDRMIGNKLFVNVYDQYIDVPETAVLTSNSKQIFTGSFIGRYIFIVRDSSDLLQVAEINVFV